MAVLLNRSYAGYAAGAVVSLDTPTETALVNQGIASNTAAVPTAGAATANATSGRAVIATSGTSVVITNAYCTPNSKIAAFLNQAVADTTATGVSRIVPAAGSFTLSLNAAATAAVVIDWAFILPTGEFMTG